MCTGWICQSQSRPCWLYKEFDCNFKAKKRWEGAGNGDLHSHGIWVNGADKYLLSFDHEIHDRDGSLSHHLEGILIYRWIHKKIGRSGGRTCGRPQITHVNKSGIKLGQCKKSRWMVVLIKYHCQRLVPSCWVEMLVVDDAKKAFSSRAPRVSFGSSLDIWFWLIFFFTGKMRSRQLCRSLGCRSTPELAPKKFEISQLPCDQSLCFYLHDMMITVSIVWKSI